MKRELVYSSDDPYLRVYKIDVPEKRWGTRWYKIVAGGRGNMRHVFDKIPERHISTILQAFKEGDEYTPGEFSRALDKKPASGIVQWMPTIQRVDQDKPGGIYDVSKGVILYSGPNTNVRATMLGHEFAHKQRHRRGIKSTRIIGDYEDEEGAWDEASVHLKRSGLLQDPAVREKIQDSIESYYFNRLLSEDKDFRPLVFDEEHDRSVSRAVKLSEMRSKRFMESLDD